MFVKQYLKFYFAIKVFKFFIISVFNKLLKIKYIFKITLDFPTLSNKSFNKKFPGGI